MGRIRIAEPEKSNIEYRIDAMHGDVYGNDYLRRMVVGISEVRFNWANPAEIWMQSIQRFRLKNRQCLANKEISLCFDYKSSTRCFECDG